MVRGRNKFKKAKPIINIIIKIMYIFPKKIRLKLFEIFRNTAGNKGIALRYVLLKTIANYVGDNVCIYPNVYILSPENLCIEDNVSIHPMCYIQAKGKIKIGSDVSIAHGATILSESHIFKEINIPIKDQGMDYKMTEIESNVWIGAKATILAGVKIEAGSIVAAGGVVNRNVIKNSIVAGVPARLIRERE